MSEPQITADTPWIGARVFGRHCAKENLPREAPKDLNPEAIYIFFVAYDQEKAKMQVDEMTFTGEIRAWLSTYTKTNVSSWDAKNLIEFLQASGWRPPGKYRLGDLMRDNLEDAVEALEAKCIVMRDALEQAQDCLLGETPEDGMSDEDALADTLEKVRKALNHHV